MSALYLGEFSRTGSNPALPPERHSSGTRPDHAFCNHSARCRFQGPPDVDGTDRPQTGVAQESVVGFAHNRIDRANPLHFWLVQHHSTMASATVHVASVPVRRMGVSNSPNSRTCVTPVIFPKPLPTCIPAGTRSTKTFPEWGNTAVTPVRVAAPSMIVACPTCTPDTSVIAFKTPGRIEPTMTPASRARIRGKAMWESGFIDLSRAISLVKFGANRPRPGRRECCCYSCPHNRVAYSKC